jgi:quercetin dioxygenase-like cupin family protein
MPSPIPPKQRWDPLESDSAHHKVELENEQIRVVRISYGAQDKSIMHQHPRGIFVFLMDGSFKSVYPGGETRNFQGKAGEFIWFEGPWEHMLENLSGKAFEALYIEI